MSRRIDRERLRLAVTTSCAPSDHTEAGSNTAEMRTRATREVTRKFRDTRLYGVAPGNNNLGLVCRGQHVLGLPRFYRPLKEHSR